MEKKVRIEPHFIIGLCAYLTSVSLSLDRSLYNLELFRQYLFGTEMPKLSQVRAAIDKRTSQPSIGLVNWEYSFSLPWLPCRIYDWLFAKSIAIKCDDLLQIAALLEFLEVQFRSDPVPDSDQAVRLRLAISTAASALSERIFFSSRRSAVMHVNHFNQSPHLELQSIQAICGRAPWPSPTPLHLNSGHGTSAEN